jgi:hypothetical protein
VATRGGSKALRFIGCLAAGRPAAEAGGTLLRLEAPSLSGLEPLISVGMCMAVRWFQMKAVGRTGGRTRGLAADEKTVGMRDGKFMG